MRVGSISSALGGTSSQPRTCAGRWCMIRPRRSWGIIQALRILREDLSVMPADSRGRSSSVRLDGQLFVDGLGFHSLSRFCLCHSTIWQVLANRVDQHLPRTIDRPRHADSIMRTNRSVGSTHFFPRERSGVPGAPPLGRFRYRPRTLTLWRRTSILRRTRPWR